MAYMARSPEARSEITRWFPEARSVVICAFGYQDGSSASEPGPGQGRLARYCLPPDYHEELGDRMRRLARWYQDVLPGAEAKVFVDSSPVMERLYARSAGIGWVGKNAMLVSQRIGSFFFLAGMAVDRVLAYDEPVPDRCGTCERCLRACPARAFAKERVLDASRCVAYFTVEHRKAAIPPEARPAHGRWIFGCDACQDACPWNRFATRSSVLVPSLEPCQDLEGLAALSRSEFNRRFKGTPLRRTGYPAVLRNVALAMGNSGEARHRPTLERLSRHEEPLVAEQARWSLVRLRIS